MKIALLSLLFRHYHLEKVFQVASEPVSYTHLPARLFSEALSDKLAIVAMLGGKGTVFGPTAGALIVAVSYTHLPGAG